MLEKHVLLQLCGQHCLCFKIPSRSCAVLGGPRGDQVAAMMAELDGVVVRLEGLETSICDHRIVESGHLGDV